MGRIVEDEAWVSGRTNAQMKFLTLFKGSCDSRGPPKPQACWGSPAWKAAQAQSSPDSSTCLHSLAGDRGHQDSERQILSPCCGEEGE